MALHSFTSFAGVSDEGCAVILHYGQLQSNSKRSQKRLDILNQSNDGFKIASEDLKLRRYGDFFGIRQSGEMQFALADIYQDAYIMRRASEEVADILGKDPELSSEDHKNLKDYLELFLADQRNKLNL